jgi:hypothetical protein
MPIIVKRAESGCEMWAMAEKPKYYNVSKVNQTKDGKDIWTRVGVLFPNRNTDGFKLRIIEGISVSGDLVISLPKAGEEQENAA